MKSQRIIRTCVAVFALFSSAVQAQAQQAQGAGSTAPVGPIRRGADTSNAQRQLPIPAARGAQDSSQVRADTHTLSSIETLGIGSLDLLRSVADPSFNLIQAGDTGITPGTRSGSTSLGMNLSFDRIWSRSRLYGYYSGAQTLFYPDSSYNTSYHSLSVSQEFHWARWGLRLRDDLLVAPEAAFGGLDTGGVGLAGGAYTLNNLQRGAGDNDTILTQRAKRLRNTTSGEVNYFLSRRSIVTFAGSYSSLTFKDPGFVDSHSVNGRVGYDYALTPKDSIALIYDYNRTDFSTGSLPQQTDAIRFSYGRRVTGRLALQVAGGPQLLRSGLQQQPLLWNVSSAMNYQTRRNQYSLSYQRSFSSGSGVFTGADSHTLMASVHRNLTRSWATVLGAGYAFNKNLAPVNGVISHFSNSYGTAGVGREFGRHVRFSLNYGIQRQASGSGACPVAGCGSPALRQMLGLTLEWHPWSMIER